MRHLLLLLLLAAALPAAAQRAPGKSLYRQYFPAGECDSAAFMLAWKGYQVLLGKGLLANERYLTVVDFTRRSNQRRLFVLDMKAGRQDLSSTVAHGLGSDPDSLTLPYRFGNVDGSRMSSLGFYVTGATYTNHRPDDSLGLCLFGLDQGYNDAAAAREIVVHYGATEYSGRVYVSDSGAARSYGCPALPLSTNTAVIQRIRGGSCLFIYSDKDKSYAAKSTVLNGGLSGRIAQLGPPPNNCSCSFDLKGTLPPAALADSLLRGRWMVDSVGVVNRGDAAAGGMRQEHLAGQVYSFREGHRFSILSKDGTESIGNYAVANEGNRLILGFQNRMMGISTKAELQALDGKLLRFRIDQGGVAFDFYLHRMQ